MSFMIYSHHQGNCRDSIAPPASRVLLLNRPWFIHSSCSIKTKIAPAARPWHPVSVSHPFGSISAGDSYEIRLQFTQVLLVRFVEDRAHLNFSVNLHHAAGIAVKAELLTGLG